MNTDDRLRQAFEDLERRTGSVDPRFSLQRLPRTPERRGWVPALAGAAAVLAVIGVVAASGFLSGPDDDVITGTTRPDSTTITEAPGSTEPGSTEPAVTTTITAPVDSGSLLPTHRVVGVAADDVLNVRRDPGAAADLVAALPPNYLGLRALDNVAVVEDGGEWRQVELVDPARVVDGGELDGQRLTGWVNTSFIEPYDPSLPEMPACQHDIGPMPEPSGPAPDHVYSVRQFGLGGCVRTVVTFGTNFDEGRWPIDGITTDMQPAGIPQMTRHQVNGTTVFVLEGVPYAWATESGDFESSVALIGRWTDGSLAIFVTVPGTTSIQVADTGQLVIDVTPDGTGVISEGGFHLIGQPVVGVGGTLEVWGLARPFEANIGTTILDQSGGPVDGLLPYVMTNDWTEAWGLFQYRASELEAGEYLLTLVREGGDQAIELAVDFTVPARDPADTVTEADLAVTDALLAFARGEIGAADGGLANTVEIALGTAHTATVSDTDDPTAWVIDEELWNGYTGPFDVLGPLRRETGITTTAVGPQPHCAAPPLDTPVAWDTQRRLSIQPAGITSCLEWYAIDVFIDGDGTIVRVILDSWEP